MHMCACVCACVRGGWEIRNSNSVEIFNIGAGFVLHFSSIKLFCISISVD